MGDRMNLAVFGATGGIGRQLVTQALDEGNNVKAFVRDANRLPVAHPALAVITVPGLTDPALLGPALKGSDAVLSAVGPRGRTAGPVTSTSIASILRAMSSAAVSRIVAVSAVPVGPVPVGESVVNRWLIPALRKLLRDNYADLATMESELRASKTAWTVMRPPRLVDGPLTGGYRTALGGNVPGGSKISRADVAHAMLATLGRPETVGQAVGVSD
jgi:putative NADH-flavin reductase